MNKVSSASWMLAGKQSQGEGSKASSSRIAVAGTIASGQLQSQRGVGSNEERRAP